MTERKFTDEEVIKALECCKKNDYSFEECKQCPYGGKCYDGDVNFLQDILDLINRQRAELKALKMDNDQLQSDIVNATMNLESVQHELDKAREEIEGYQHLKVILNTAVDVLAADIKTKAIKEFAESMKKRERSNAYCCFCAHATIYGDRAKECDEPYIDKDGKEHSHCLMFSKFESYIDKLVEEMTEVQEQ